METMSHAQQFYIDGAWVRPAAPKTLPVINPATEEPYIEIAVGGAADVDRAVAAARAAFPAFSETSKEERLALLRRILALYNARAEEIARAVSIADANDTPYGLAAYVQSQDLPHARRVARRLRAGQVNINYPDWDTFAPFGGYKQSGNGREYADWAIHDFLELKGIIGYGTE
ncbi:MAG: aldehyde dehydrogenase family protein [Dongiaceae bacterium]